MLLRPFIVDGVIKWNKQFSVLHIIVACYIFMIHCWFMIYFVVEGQLILKKRDSRAATMFGITFSK